MDTIKYITNHHIYHGKYYPNDMTSKEKQQVESAYGGLIDIDQEFIFYRGYPYCMRDCMQLPDNSPFDKYWHGYFDDAFSSSILVHIDPDNDGYIFCLAYS
jgi:hypothetical protein